MSGIDEGLVLHLILDQTTGDGRVLDSSGNGNHGKPAGDYDIYEDETFGSCFNFDGNSAHIAFDKFPESTGNQLACCLWVRSYGGGREGFGTVLSGEVSGKQTLHLKLTDGVQLDVFIGGENGHDPVRARLMRDKWSHVAVTHDGTTMNLYINGVPARSLSMEKAGGTFAGLDQFWIGSQSGNGPFFYGRMAHVRVYDRALSVQEVKTVMEHEKAALAGFRKSHPIAFSLLDEDDHAVLYIDDDPREDHVLVVELCNTADLAIELKEGEAATASPQNHHFELRFRPDTLSAKTITKLLGKNKKEAIPTDWDLFVAPEITADRHVSLYFLYTGTEKRLLGPGGRVNLPLKHISANPGSGARGTRVELVPYPQMVVFQADPTPITGNRVQHIHVTNHQGRKHIPLHVGFIGPDTILNDGSKNKLRLRLTNTSTQPLSLATATFILAFDVGEVKTAEWALGTQGQVKNMQVKVVGNDEPVEVHEPTGDEDPVPEWVIEGDSIPLKQLKKGQHLEISLSKIETNHPSGPTNLYLAYQNVPGYWDGRFVCTIRKAPLLFCDTRDDEDFDGGLSFGESGLWIDMDNINRDGTLYLNYYSQEPVHIGNNGKGDLHVFGNISVGISEPPSSKLEIKGETADDSASSLQVKDSNNNSLLFVRNDGRVEIGSEDNKAAVEVVGKEWDQHLILTNTNDSSPGPAIYFKAAKRNWAIIGTNNQAGAKGEKFGLFDATVNKYRMVIDKDGNIGIGKSDPNFKLDVKGDKGWIGSSDNSQVEGGWRLGKWPAYGTERWLYLSRTDRDADDKTTYQNLALGDLWVQGKIQTEKIQDLWGNNIFHIGDVNIDGQNTKCLHLSRPFYLLIDGTYWRIQRKGFTWTNEHYAALDAYETSDLRFKKNMNEISEALEKVTLLKGVTYQWNEEGLKRFARDIENTVSAGPEATLEENQKLWDIEREKLNVQLSGNNIGMIAQEVETVVPEVVHIDEEGYKSVAYDRLIPVLIEAIKEQNVLVEQLRGRVAALEKAAA